MNRKVLKRILDNFLGAATLLIFVAWIYLSLIKGPVTAFIPLATLLGIIVGTIAGLTVIGVVYFYRIVKNKPHLTKPQTIMYYFAWGLGVIAGLFTTIFFIFPL